MGIQVDHNKPYTPEIKQYLKDRGRAYLIPANERRFGEDGTREPEEHEQAESHAVSPFYNPEVRQAAVYDVGGAPLPNTTLDYNTGRVADRENGKTVEFTGPGHTPGASDLRDGRREPDGVFSGYDVDDLGNPVDDNIDDDIIEYVTSLPNKTELVKALAEAKAVGAEHGVEVDYKGDDNRDTLENKLAVAYEDLRRAGVEIFESDDSDDDDETEQE